MKGDTLWTKDFTIITLGTVVSMLGNAMSGFAISILVLDFTGSTFLYALFMVVYNLPKTVMPLLVGPYLDTFSRKKVIYVLDFVSSGLYFITFFLLRADAVTYVTLLLAAMLFGAIDSIYTVAYDSLYPNLIPKGQSAKAYSVSSMIYPLAAVMVPVAAWLYDAVGIAFIFLINAGSFFVAACFETQIKAEEKHTGDIAGRYDFKNYSSDFKAGLRYIWSEKGLLAITLFYTLMFWADGSNTTLILPYFRQTIGLSAMLYTFVMGGNILGRVLGGAFHYRTRMPADSKYKIAYVIYVVLALSSGLVLFAPLWAMVIIQFISGVLGVTTYNIRVSTTQDYIPDSHRARFNGVFSMVTAVGLLAGQLMAGAAAELMPIRGVMVLFWSVYLALTIVIFARNGTAVKKIFNRHI